MPFATLKIAACGGGDSRGFDAEPTDLGFLAIWLLYHII